MQLVGGKLYVNRTSLDADAGNYLLMEIDEKTGVQTDSCLKADDYNRGWNFALRLPFSFFYSKNTDAPKYVEMFSDTIMAVTKEGIKPYCVVKSEDFVSKKRMKNSSGIAARGKSLIIMSPICMRRIVYFAFPALWSWMECYRSNI